jgi:tRNA dimethylallyltransferase
VLVGPTGTGKSRLAVEVAERIGGEIVGCDALQVYRGLDAATGKPTAEERARVPHSLIDVVDPRRDYSLADFVRDADAAIAAIAGRGRVPVVAGGTGLYLRGLLKGIVDAPARDAGLRDRLRAVATRFGPERLHRRLGRLDPGSAARIPQADTQRIVRALELALAAGPSWSERLASEGTWGRSAERYAALKFGLDLGDEVRRLLADGVPATANAFKAIGYREVLHAVTEGRDPRAERDAIVTATRRYAKRQRTWFRTEAGLTWLDAARGAGELADEIAANWRRFRAC